MTFTGAPPKEVLAAAVALGVLGPDGRLNDEFFASPLRELKDTLRPRVRRRQALEALNALLPADPLLSGAGVPTGDGARRSVHPLLPGLTRGQLSLTVTLREEVAHLDVVVGLAGEYRAGDGTVLAAELPLVRARDDQLVAIAGTPDGPLAVDLVKPLGDEQSATVRALVTADGGRLVVGLHGVDLGAGTLPDLEVDTAELGEQAVATIVALLRALLAAVEAGDDAVLRALVDHLPGALGLETAVPALPLLALARDARAFRAWLAAQVPAEGDVPALRTWVTHLLGLLGIDAAPPVARPTSAAPWIIPLSTGGPAMELTLALGRRAASGERSLRTGLRLRAGDASTGVELSLEATLLDLPLGGEEPAALLPWATVVVVSPPTGGAGPLVDEPTVGVGALRAGLSWDGRRLEPLLELDEVRLPGAPPFERLDLSSADTLATTAHEVLGQALREALGETGLARPLRVLAGLDDVLDHRVDPVGLATEPLATLRRFHRVALERPEGWAPQVAALAALLGTDVDPDAVAGAGTPDDPWSVPIGALSSPELAVRLLAWDATPAGPLRGLRVALAVAADAGDPEWSFEWRATLLAADLGTVGPARLRLLGEQRARAHAAVASSGGAVSADAVTLQAAWTPGSTLTATATLEGVAVAGGAPEAVTLGDVVLPGALDPAAPDLGLGVEPERAWRALRTLLGRAASAYGGTPGLALAALLGVYDGGVPELPDDWPSLPLPDAGDVRSVLDDVAALARERLARLADGAEGLGATGEPHARAGLRLMGSLLAGGPAGGPGPPAARARENAPDSGPGGAGSRGDPWWLPLADSGVRALAWLEPDGPPAAWARAAGAALDGDLDGALAAGARSLPGVGDALVGRGAGAVRAAVDRLAGALEGTDGLVPADAAGPADPAWRTGEQVTAAHHLLPRAPAAVTQVRDEIAARTAGLESGDWAVLLVGPSFVPAGLWDEVLAAVGASEPAGIDLAAAAAPEFADLGAVPAAAFYDVRLRDDGEADVETQLTRVADRVRELRSGCRLLVVAHSTAGGPAARYVADHGAGVLGLITLGSPLAAVPTGPLDDPALADALRTVRALLPRLGVPELDDALGFLHDALEGYATARPGDVPRPFVVPSSSFTDVPELPDVGHTPALAIAAALPGRLAEAVERALADALQALPDDPGHREPTHAVVGVEAALELPEPDGGDVRVELDGALELGAVSLAPDGLAAPRAPRLQVRARIIREGGALLDGHVREAELDFAARVRWAELIVEAGDDEPASFSVRLHEAALRGVRRAVAGLDEAVGRQLFALLVEELDHVAAGSARLRALLDLLTDDVGVLARETTGRLAVAADAVAALRSDAAAWLAGRLPDLLDRETGLLGLVRDPLAAAGSGPWRRTLRPLPLELEIRREPWMAAVRTTGQGLSLGPEARLAGAARVPLAGGDPTLDAFLQVGALKVGRAAQRTTVAVEGVLEPTAIERGAATRDALLEALAHLAGSGALAAVMEGLLPERLGHHLRDIPALLRDPGGLLHARMHAAGDPATLRALLAEAGAAIGLAVRDDGTVELPGDLALAVSGADGLLRIELATPEDGLAIEGAATLRIDAAVAVDGARGVAPAASIALGADLPGGWGHVTLLAALEPEGVRIAVEPAGGGELTLLPRFSGWQSLVGGAAERLLAQALDGLAVAVPESPLRSAALDVARTLGVLGTSFGNGAVALRELAMETVADRAEAAAEASAALLERGIAATLPAGATLTADGPAVRLEVPDILGGRLSLAAELDVPAVALEIGDATAGAGRAELGLRWTAAVAGDLDLDIDLGSALGFELVPRLSVRMREADALSVLLLPLGAGSGERAGIALAPAPGVALTDAGRDDLARTWLAPPALHVVLDAAAAQLDRPIHPGGPTARALLRAAGVLGEEGTLRVPLPAPLEMLAGLAPELAGELELPLGLEGATLALDGGASGDRLGAVLRGDVALPVSGLDVGLLFGDGLTLELLTREDGDWTLRPRLRLERVGAGLARSDGERLLDTSLVTLGALGARAGTVLELTAGDGGFAPGPWRTELDLREIGLPALTGVAGDNPVASSLLQTATRDMGDTEPATPPIDLLVRFDAGELALIVAGAAPGRPRWFEIERSFGPLHIGQIGVETGEAPLPSPGGGSERLDYVGVLLDASVAVGGLAVAADGLALRIPPKYVGDPRRWGLELDGLGLAYRQAGLTVEGALLRGADGDEYRGTVRAQMADRGFAGVGAYGRPSDPLGDDYTSLLAFAVVTAPLGGPPYLYVTALAGGAGYNRRLLVPTEPEGVGAFPLVQALRGDLGATPLAALERLGEAMPPRRGSLWIAAGLRFTTFAVLRTVAVAHAALDRGLEIGLLGLTSAALPSAGKEIASLELALAARYRDVDRVLSVRAQLTDNSWLLSRDCQLTGGFALVMWFAEDRAVLTVGGYHPDFPIPADFPRVPRVGFHWAVSDGIVVKGEAYFAITTSAAMTGGRLEVSYDRDPVRVWFRASFDVLVRYKPFWFRVDAAISVGAAFHFEVCFFACATIHVGVEVGARLHLEGPPLRGRVTVDLAIASVSVPFGPAQPLPTHLSWSDFIREYLVEDPGEAPTRARVTAGAAATDAAAQAPDGSEARPLRVLPEFALATEGTVPCVDARFAERDPQDGDVAAGFLVAPTGPAPHLAARHVVALEARGAEGWVGVDRPPDRLVVELVEGRVSEAVFVPAPGTLDDVRPSAPLVPALTGLQVTARSEVHPAAALGDIPIAEIVDDSDPLPLPLTGGGGPAPARASAAPQPAAARGTPAAPPGPVLRTTRRGPLADGTVPRTAAGRHGDGLPRMRPPAGERDALRRLAGRRPAVAAGLRAAAGEGDRSLAPGETQVWQLPGGRWRLALRGDGAARVVCLNGSGHVLADREGAWPQGAVDLPQGTVRLALTGLGDRGTLRSLWPAPGAVAHARAPAGARPAAGWQSHTRLLQVAPSTLLAPGAVVALPAPWTAHGDRDGAWHPAVGAAELACALPGLATQLPARIRTLLVQLDRRAEGADLDGVAITALGLTLGAPERVEGGERLTLVYGVDDADTGDERVTVSVACGEGWTPAGVVGVLGEPADWAGALCRAPRIALVGDAVPSAHTALTVALTPEEVA